MQKTADIAFCQMIN